MSVEPFRAHYYPRYWTILADDRLGYRRNCIRSNIKRNSGAYEDTRAIDRKILLLGAGMKCIVDDGRIATGVVD